MHSAEGVHAANQVHPQLQGLDLVGPAPVPTHQAGQPTAERGVEPLDVRGVGLSARPSTLQHSINSPKTSPDDLHQTPSAVVRNDLAQEDSPGQAIGRSASSSCVDLRTKGFSEGRHVASQPIGADQENPTWCGVQANRYQIDDVLDEAQVPHRAHHTAQPEPRRHGQGHGQPAGPADGLAADLIGLHMLEIGRGGVEEVMMDGPSMVPGLVLPCCHRAFI